METLNYEIQVLSKLVSFPTDSTKKSYYKECAEYLVSECKKIGLKTDILDAINESKDGLNRPNVVAKLDLGKDKTVALLTHFDVVPAGKNWKKDPFRLTIEGDKIYGRGVADDKGNIAVALGALREVKEKANCNIVFLAMCDEEVGGEFGAGYVEKNLKEKIDEVLVLDAGNEFVGIGASGVVFGEIKVYGDQGHAGYPFMYRNAVEDLLRLGYHLRRFSLIRSQKISKLNASPLSPVDKVFGRFTITMLGGGEKENVIPSEAFIRFDMRLIPEENLDTAINELKSYLLTICSKLEIKAEISWIRGGGNYYSDPDHPSVKKFVEVANRVYGKSFKVGAEFGGNDGRYFANRNIPIISFGLAGRDSNFHGPDEHVSYNDIIKMKSLLTSYLVS
jgi:Acetylornithine deacetylase/Succinyl-diaminopimelate desuccinylase and related deacylases